MGNNFFTNRASGRRGEVAAYRELVRGGCELVRGDEQLDKDDSVWRFEKIDFRVEVKTDFKTQYTGNIAIEVWNPRSGKASGLTASHADVWMTVLAPAMMVFAVRTRTLREFVNVTQPKREILLAGDGNSRILLFDARQIITLGWRLDCFSRVGLSVVLKHLVQGVGCETNRGTDNRRQY